MRPKADTLEAEATALPDSLAQVRTLLAETARVAADRAAGGTARLETVPGDHLALINPFSPAWQRTRALIDDLAAAAPAGH